MSRAPRSHELPRRRPSIGERVEHSGQTFFLHFGFDSAGNVREIFCAAKRSTADVIATLESTCIVLSKALQMGISVADLAASVDHQDGFIAAILTRAAAAELEHGPAMAKLYRSAA